jgi:hypothetical protein
LLTSCKRRGARGIDLMCRSWRPRARTACGRGSSSIELPPFGAATAIVTHQTAGGMDETLALFETHVPAHRWPRLSGSEVWNSLPADPRRRLRIADADADAQSA